MGHEVIIYGRIVGATRKPGKDYQSLHDYNRVVLDALPIEDDWPCLVRAMFALPADRPMGTYRRQIIHFGASIKDDPNDLRIWETWLEKFERLLRKLYWFSARVHLETEFEGPLEIEWLPTASAKERLRSDPPQPTDEWMRTGTLPGAARRSGAS